MKNYHKSQQSDDTPSRLVYSTDSGRFCSKCGATKHLGACAKQDSLLENQQGDGIVRIQRQTKGRKGKGVTLITGLQLSNKELVTLAKQLKKQCGAGGTVKEGIIEIQGDYRETLLVKLQKLGYDAKLAGG